MSRPLGMHVPETKTVENLLLAELKGEISKLDFELPILHLMVGLPYSGKTTIAKELAHPIVCPDAIRVALHGQRFRAESEPMVWAMAQVMVRALFGAGHRNVILDACHGTKKRRTAWVEDGWRTVEILVQTNRDTCIERARAADDEFIVPVIARMAREFEWPGSWRP